MKEIIVIIEGANYLRSDNRFFQGLIVLFYKLFNVVPIYSGEHEKWLRLIAKENREILYFPWSGSFLPWRVRAATKELVAFLDDKPNVKVIATSLGTEIVLDALPSADTIDKIISLSGVYQPRAVDIPFVDIYSTSDRFARFFRFILRTFSLHKKMKREEVVLHSIRHDQFRDNTRLDCNEFKGKSMAWLINNALDA